MRPTAPAICCAEYAALCDIERRRGRRRNICSTTGCSTAATEPTTRSAVVAPVVSASSAATTTGRRASSRSCRRRAKLAHVARLDLDVNDVRVGWSDRHGDATVRSGREPAAGHLVPGATGVRGLPESAPRATAVEATARAHTLIRCRVQRVRIRRVHHKVSKAGVLVDVLHFRPVPAAVSRLVDAAVRARAKEVARCCSVHDFGIARVDHDAGDGLCFAQPEELPRRTAVGRLVHPAAERCGLPVVGLARADVHDVGVRRVDSDVAD